MRAGPNQLISKSNMLQFFDNAENLLSGFTREGHFMFRSNNLATFKVLDQAAGYDAEVCRLSLTSTGFGVSTDTPTAECEVKGRIRSIGSGGVTYGGVYASDVAGSVTIGTETAHPAVFTTTNVERMRLSESGPYLSVGNTTALGTCYLYDSATGASTSLNLRAGVNQLISTTNLLGIYDNGSNALLSGITRSGNLFFHSGNLATFKIVDQSAGAAAETTKLAMTSSYVGVLTDSPTAPLEVAGRIRSAGAGKVVYGGLFSSDAAGMMTAGTETNHAFGICTNNVERARVSAAGGLSWGAGYLSTDAGLNNVLIEGSLGVGLNNPTAAIDALGRIRSSGTSGTVKTSLYSSTAAGAGYFGTETNHALILQTNSADVMRLTGDRNAGLLTATPGGSGTAGVGVLSIGNGTVPVGGVDGQSSFFAKDVGGKSEMYLINENGLATQLSGSPYAQVVTVAKTGAEYATIQGAIDAIVDATTSKRYCVKVQSGVYAENVVMKDYVDLQGSGRTNAIISATTGTALTFPATKGSVMDMGITAAYGTLGAASSAILSGGADSELIRCNVTVSKTAGVFIMNGIKITGGAFRMTDSRFTYTITGAAAAALEQSAVCQTGAATIVLVHNCEVTMAGDDAASDLVGFETLAGSAGSFLVQDTIFSATNTGTGGFATGLYLHGTATGATIGQNRVTLSAPANTWGYYVVSNAGGAIVNSRHNEVITSGAGTNYYAYVDSGDTLNSAFDKMTAAGGRDTSGTGTGTVNLTSTLTEGVITATNGITGAGVMIVKVVPFIENATNTVHTGTVPIPAGSVVESIKVVNTVLWGATSATLVVGDSFDADGYFTGVNCKATDLLVGEILDINSSTNWGGKEGAYLNATTGRRGSVQAGNSGIYYGVADNIIGVMTVGTPAATTGRTFMTVTYSTPQVIAAVATGP